MGTKGAEHCCVIPCGPDLCRDGGKPARGYRFNGHRLRLWCRSYNRLVLRLRSRDGTLRAKLGTGISRNMGGPGGYFRRRPLFDPESIRENGGPRCPLGWWCAHRGSDTCTLDKRPDHQRPGRGFPRGPCHKHQVRFRRADNLPVLDRRYMLVTPPGGQAGEMIDTSCEFETPASLCSETWSRLRRNPHSRKHSAVPRVYNRISASS